RDISARVACERQNLVPGDGDVNLAMNLVEGHLIVPVVISALDLRTRSLNRADGRLFSIGVSPERQDRLGERTVDADFIVNRVIGQGVHRAAGLGLLALQGPYR